MYKTQKLEKPMMDNVREKHARFQVQEERNSFLGEKDCRLLQVEAVKKERLGREEQQRIEREADMEAEQVRARELELEQEFNLRLERAVQERVRADAASRTGNISSSGNYFILVGFGRRLIWRRKYCI